MSYALDGGNLFVPTLCNCLLNHCFASLPDAEMRSLIVYAFLIWFIDGDTACYLGISELLKIWCFLQDICTHLVNFHLKFVRKH